MKMQFKIEFPDGRFLVVESNDNGREVKLSLWDSDGLDHVETTVNGEEFDRMCRILTGG